MTFIHFLIIPDLTIDLHFVQWRFYFSLHNYWFICIIPIICSQIWSGSCPHSIAFLSPTVFLELDKELNSAQSLIFLRQLLSGGRIMLQAGGGVWRCRLLQRDLQNTTREYCKSLYVCLQHLQRSNACSMCMKQSCESSLRHLRPFVTFSQ